MSCHIHSKKNSHITAASVPIALFPMVLYFLIVHLLPIVILNKVSLGRPWTPTASVAYINCKMDKHIIPEGWNNWKNPANEATVRYAEFNSTGLGANTIA